MDFLTEAWDAYHWLYAHLDSLAERPVGPFGVDCLEGHAAIEMAPVREKFGSLYLPDELTHTMRSDAGWVIGSGVPVEVGSLVLVAYGHGLRVKDYRNDVYDSRKRAIRATGDEKAHGVVAFTGCAGGEMISDEYGNPDEPCSPVPWWESIVAVREQEDWSPTGQNVRIRLRPVKSSGVIELVRKRYEPECEIVSVGPSAFTRDGKKWADVRPGETYVFDEGAVKRFVGSDEAVIPDFGLHARV